MRSVKGQSTSEFWVVAAFLADLLFQRIGLYNYITLDQLADVTAQVRVIADKLQGDTGSDSWMIYGLGMIYVAGRTWLKKNAG